MTYLLNAESKERGLSTLLLGILAMESIRTPAPADYTCGHGDRI